jgi:integrase
MAGKQAKVLSDNDVSDLLAFAGRSRNPTRNEVIVMLSAKAGLRAGEIAKLTWDMVLDPRGLVGFTLELHDNAAKNGSGRIVPVHADLRRALIAWREVSNEPGAIIRSERGGPMTALSIVVWFQQGVSNHWVEGVLVPLWPTNLHHPSGAARA